MLRWQCGVVRGECGAPERRVGRGQCVVAQPRASFCARGARGACVVGCARLSAIGRAGVRFLFAC
eukprot:4683946-Lingulodinium_polyedra.AAC.1